MHSHFGDNKLLTMHSIRNNDQTNLGSVKVDEDGRMCINPGVLTDPLAQLDVRGDFRAAYNTDTTSYIGRAAIGHSGHNNSASFSHLDNNTVTKYALRQTIGGTTVINAPSGQVVDFRINNT